MKKKHLVFLLAVVVALACKRNPEGKNAATKPAVDEVNSRVILTVADQEFTNDHFKGYIQNRYSQVVTDTPNPRLLRIFFDRFVEEKILLEKTAREKTTVSEEEIAAYLKSINMAGETQINRDEIASNVKVQKYLLNHVYKAITVPDREIEQYYQDHLSEYEKKEEIFLYQIMVREKDKAIRLRSELMNTPERFEEIARRDSVSVEGAEGGKMGFFEKGHLPQEMENVVFSIKVGTISPVVETPFGFHIFKVTQHRGAKRMNYAQVKPSIQEKLISERMSAAYQEFIDLIKKDIPFAISEENLYFHKDPTPPNGEFHE